MLSSPTMPFGDLQQFMRFLEKAGELKRVRVEVDPELEVTEITQRVLRDGGPALLFERPRGSSVPLLTNIFGTVHRVHAALGGDPLNIGFNLLNAIQRLNPPSLKAIWHSRDFIKRALFTRPRQVRRARCQEIIESPDLSRFPILKCWPEDAGRFITWGMVITHDPSTRRRNVGLYRLQVFGDDMTGMHWQSMKGGIGRAHV